MRLYDEGRFLLYGLRIDGSCFYDYHAQIVLPACKEGSDCSSKPNGGWVTLKPKKAGISQAKKSRQVFRSQKKSTKRKAAQLKIDLKTYKCTKIEHSFEIWLAESKLAWDQLRYEIRTKRQMKKQRRSA